MNRRFRFWMSGCVAVISLALAGMGDAWADVDDDGRPARWLTSRFDLTQTVQRLQARAPQHGLTVLAHWTPRPAGDAAAARAGLAGGVAGLDRQTRLVLVFGSLAGGTPVLMAGDGARPDLPLSLRLRTRSDGVVEVLMPADLAFDGNPLPAELARELVELPGLVADAIA